MTAWIALYLYVAGSFLAAMHGPFQTVSGYAFVLLWPIALPEIILTGLLKKVLRFARERRDRR